MQGKNLVVGAILLAGISYGVGRYLQPAEVKIEIKEIIKEVEIEKRNVVTIIREIVRPDGTKEVETRIVDKTTTEKDKTEMRSEIKKVKALKPQWRASIMAGIDGSFKNPIIYGAQIERRILGPFSLGVWGMTNKTAGFSVSWEF